MKKFLIIVLLVLFAFTLNLSADSIKSATLGAPIALLKDTSIIGTYPGALQLFPSAVWLTVTAAATPPTFGVAYIASDLVGIASMYSTSADNFTISDPQPALTASLGLTAVPGSITAAEHIWFMYGVKFGNLAAGMMVQNSFANPTVLNQTIDSNGNVIDETLNSGFKTMIKPSAVLDLGKMKIYTSIYATLNFLKYNQFNSYQTNEITITPEALNKIGVDGTVSFDLGKGSKKFIAAAKVNFEMKNDGYSATLTTNAGTAVYSGTNYKNSSTSINLTLGALVQANDVTTLYFDIPFGIKFSDVGHWDGVTPYNKTTKWTLPVLKAGADINLGKGFSFRASAAPSWSRTTTEPASTKGSNANSKTVTDTYSISSALGLGYRTGKLSINAEVSGTAFSTDSLSPLNLIGGLFTGGAQQYFTAVQFNWFW